MIMLKIFFSVPVVDVDWCEFHWKPAFLVKNYWFSLAYIKMFYNQSDFFKWNFNKIGDKFKIIDGKQ